MKLQSLFRRTLLGALCTGLTFVVPGIAHAWGEKPLRLIVPAPPGGTIDVVARVLSDELSKEIKQPVIVENKPGAGGVIAVQALMSAPADGQTLMVTASNLLTEVPLIVKVSFDPLKDLRPVATVARTSIVLVGGPGVPAKDVKSLVSYVKANPGTIAFATYSPGTVAHYAGLILNQKAGLDMQHVPFLGSPPALAQVVGGQIPLMFDGIPTSKPMISAGKIKAFGVTSKTRSLALPDVPTFAEQGYPEFDFSNWLGVVAASNVPQEILEKIRAVTLKAAASPKMRERMTALGFEAGLDETQGQLAQSVRADYDRNAAIVKTFDIKINQ